MKSPPFAGVLLLLSLAFARGAHAQVDASLVSSQAVATPGKAFVVAIRLVHRPEWHTYWLNPGTGLATSVKWTLPSGWSAGDIQWPAPQVITDRQGNVTGNGYSGDLLLPVTITPSAGAPATGTVKLNAAVEWLMCQNVCEPGNATLSIDQRMGPDPRRDAQWSSRIAKVMADLPRSDSNWQISAQRSDKDITVTLAPGPGAAAHPDAKSLHFFADDNLVGYELPQSVAVSSSGAYVLKLTVTGDSPPTDAALHGVVVAAGVWGPHEPALRVDATFGAAPASAAAATGAAAVSTPLAPTLLLAFVGGLILNLMPCVFPVLGIKILGFVNQAGTDRRKVVGHGLVFSAGVLLSFWALAAILAALRKGGAQLGWGFQLQSPAFIFALAGAMLVFALNLSGVFEFGLSATRIGGTLQSGTGYSGSFFTGVLATMVATPCSAPFLAPALGAALTLSLFDAWAVFTCIALGLSTPYLLLSAFPQAVRILPRPGAWMETFKQLMAFPLYGTVGYLIWVLAGQLPDTGFLNAVLALVVIALGIWLYGRYHAPGASPGRALFGLVGALVLLLIGAWIGWPVAAQADAVVWEKWTPEEVARLHAEGRIVYVDFTARWCATCQANKKIVFHSPAVLEEFRQRHVATLRGDWTSQDPAITAELQKYHRSAVPFNQVWLPAQDQPVLLPEVLTPSTVLKAVESRS